MPAGPSPPAASLRGSHSWSRPGAPRAPGSAITARRRGAHAVRRRPRPRPGRDRAAHGRPPAGRPAVGRHVRARRRGRCGCVLRRASRAAARRRGVGPVVASASAAVGFAASLSLRKRAAPGALRASQVPIVIVPKDHDPVHPIAQHRARRPRAHAGAGRGDRRLHRQPDRAPRRVARGQPDVARRRAGGAAGPHGRRAVRPRRRVSSTTRSRTTSRCWSRASPTG